MTYDILSRTEEMETKLREALDWLDDLKEYCDVPQIKEFIADCKEFLEK